MAALCVRAVVCCSPPVLLQARPLVPGPGTPVITATPTSDDDFRRAGGTCCWQGWQAGKPGSPCPKLSSSPCCRLQDHPRAGQPRVVHPLRRGWAANRGGGRAQAQPSPRLHLRVPSRWAAAAFACAALVPWLCLTRDWLSRPPLSPAVRGGPNTHALACVHAGWVIKGYRVTINTPMSSQVLRFIYNLRVRCAPLDPCG